jgi:regulator of protease activity HflC (stomatin/prohibitin superfamily)
MVEIDEIKGFLKKGQWKGLLIAVVVIIVLFLFGPWVQVEARERGVVLNFGAVQDVVLGEGLHFIIPVVQSVVLMDVKIQKAKTDAESSSSDLQDVDLSVALNYHT